MLERSSVTLFGWLVGIGAIIGIGQMLASAEKVTIRIAVGRTICSAGLAASSSVVVAFFPDLTLPAQLGLAAAVASLGTSGLERLLQRFLSRGQGYGPGPGNY